MVEDFFDELFYWNSYGILQLRNDNFNEFFFFFVELDKFGKENGIERRKKIPIPLRRKELKNK